MKKIPIDLTGSLYHYRLFIYFKNIARNESPQFFFKQYMNLLLYVPDRIFINKFFQLKEEMFGKFDTKEFYPKWLYYQYIKKYGSLQKDIPIKEIKKDFNYYYREGFVSFGKMELVGDEHKSFIGGYNAAKNIFLNRQN